MAAVEVSLVVDGFAGFLGAAHLSGPLWRDRLLRPRIHHWVPAPLLLASQAAAVLLLGSVGGAHPHEHPRSAAPAAAVPEGSIALEVEEGLAQLVQIRGRPVNPKGPASSPAAAAAAQAAAGHGGSFVAELLLRLYAFEGFTKEPSAAVATTATAAAATAAAAGAGPASADGGWLAVKAPLHRVLLLLGTDARRTQQKAMAFTECCCSRKPVQQRQHDVATLQHETEWVAAPPALPPLGADDGSTIVASSSSSISSGSSSSSGSSDITSTVNLAQEELIVPPRLPAGHPLELVRCLGDLYVQSPYPYTFMAAAADVPDLPAPVQQNQLRQQKQQQQQQPLRRALVVAAGAHEQVKGGETHDVQQIVAESQPSQQEQQQQQQQQNGIISGVPQVLSPPVTASQPADADCSGKPLVWENQQHQRQEQQQQQQQQQQQEEFLDRLLLVHPEAAGVSVTFGLPPSDLSPWHLLSVEALPLSAANRLLLQQILRAQQALDRLDAAAAASAARTAAAGGALKQASFASMRRALSQRMEEAIRQLCDAEGVVWFPALELSGSWAAPTWYASDYSPSCTDTRASRLFALGFAAPAAPLAAGAAPPPDGSASAAQQRSQQQQQQQLLPCPAGCCKGIAPSAASVLRRLDEPEQQQRMQQLLQQQHQAVPERERQEHQGESSSSTSCSDAPTVSPPSNSMSLLDRATAQLLRLLRGSKPRNSGSNLSINGSSSSAEDEHQQPRPVQLPPRPRQGSVGEARRRSWVTPGAGGDAAGGPCVSGNACSSGKNSEESSTEETSAEAEPAPEDCIHLLSGVVLPREASVLQGVWAVDFRVSWREDAAGCPLDAATGRPLQLKETVLGAEGSSSSSNGRSTPPVTKKVWAFCGPELGLVPVVYGSTLSPPESGTTSSSSSSSSSGAAAAQARRAGQEGAGLLIPPPSERFFLVSCKSQLVREKQQAQEQQQQQQQQQCLLLPVRERASREGDEQEEETAGRSQLPENIEDVERLLLQAYSSSDHIPLEVSPIPPWDRVCPLSIHPTIPAAEPPDSFDRSQVVRLQDLAGSPEQQHYHQHQLQQQQELQQPHHQREDFVSRFLASVRRMDSGLSEAAAPSGAVSAAAVPLSAAAASGTGLPPPHISSNDDGKSGVLMPTVPAQQFPPECSLCWHRFVVSDPRGPPDGAPPGWGFLGNEGGGASAEASILGAVQSLFLQPHQEQHGAGGEDSAGTAAAAGTATAAAAGKEGPSESPSVADGEGAPASTTPPARWCSAVFCLQISVSLSQQRLVRLRKAHSDYVAAKLQASDF
ncbi:hypothetical protein Emag_002994 [Eimeria magna]